jgi:hypothetical protein
LVVQPNEDDAGRVVDACRQKIAKIQIKGQDDPPFLPSFVKDGGVRKTRQLVFAQVDGVIPLFPKALHGAQGNPHVRQELHELLPVNSWTSLRASDAAYWSA